MIEGVTVVSWLSQNFAPCTRINFHGWSVVAHSVLNFFFVRDFCSFAVGGLGSGPQPSHAFPDALAADSYLPYRPATVFSQRGIHIHFSHVVGLLQSFRDRGLRVGCVCQGLSA